MNVKTVASGAMSALVGVLLALAPTLAIAGGAAVERAFTVPEDQVQRLGRNLSEDDQDLLKQMFRRLADTLSDILVLIASRGAVRPDDEDEYKGRF